MLNFVLYLWLIHSCLRIRKRSFFFILNDCCSLVLEFLSKLAARAMWHDIVNRGKRDETFATFWTTKLSNFMLISQFGPVSGRRVSVVYPLPRSFTVLHSQWQIYWLWNKKTSFCRRVSSPSVKSLEIVSNDFFYILDRWDILIFAPRGGDTVPYVMRWLSKTHAHWLRHSHQTQQQQRRQTSDTC